MVNTTYKVLEMDCPSCASLIESDLDDLGVIANCSYAKSVLKVKFDETKITQEDIIKTVAKSGYKLYIKK